MNRIANVWNDSIEFIFVILCLRFIGSSIYGAGSIIWPAFVLTAGGFLLGWRHPKAGLFAFTAGLPLLNGARLFSDCPVPPSLVFAGIFLGVTFESMLRRRYRIAEASSDANGGPFVHLSITLLISALMLSLGAQLWSHRSAQLVSAFVKRPTFGFGDPYYFLTATFIWLQGLFYFRFLMSTGAVVATWIRPVFVIGAVLLVTCFIFQYACDFPEAYNGYAYYFPSEDISAAGSIAVAILIFFVARSTRRMWPLITLSCLGFAALLTLVIASWSRAAWLSGILFFGVISSLRLRWRWNVMLAFVGIATLVAINLNANRPTWLEQPYLWRLASLFRIENPTHKDSTRIDLFEKALRMSRNRPFSGYGIGSYYLTSVYYARPGDPYGQKPEFAHNAFLQVAAELGMPMAMLFLGLCIWVICRGLRTTIEIPARDRPIPRSSEERGRCKRAGCLVLGHQDLDGLTLLGATLALAAYLETQMTANSLNVYASNQYFFWFLMAVVIVYPERRVSGLPC